MVPLLMVTMTGMVIGQQQDSSDQFRSNINNPANQNSSRAANFTPIGQAADGSKLAPFELSVSDNDILGIRKTGSVLRSKIAPKDPSTGQPLPLHVISGISLVHKDNLNRDLPVRKIRGENAGNGVIRFGLNDFDLMKLQNNIKLGFDFDNESRGKFQMVEFYHKTNDSVANSGPTPDDNRSSRATFGGSNSQARFGQPQTTPVPMLPPPGPEALPGGIAFEGPVRPSRNTGFPSNQQNALAQNRSGPGWAPERGAPTNPAFNRQNPQPSPGGWDIPKQPQTPNPNTASQSNNFDPARDRWLAMQRQAELDRLAKLEQQKIQESVNSFANHWRDPAKSPVDNSNSNSFAPIRTHEQQIAQRQAELELQRKSQQLETYLAAQQRALAEKEAELKKRQQDLDYQRYVDGLRTHQPQDITPNVTRPTGIVSGTDFRPTGPVIAAPERFASNDPNQGGRGYGQARLPVPVPNRGVKDLAMQVPGINQNLIGNNTLATQDKRTEHFVYFMLLCSLGLNVYLAWISRGFYVRYNELADELRDTFTATM
jgi:hypothetical protein